MFIRSLTYSFRKQKWSVVILVLILIMAIFCEKKYSETNFNETDVKHFEKTLTAKETRAEQILDGIYTTLSEKGEEVLFSKLSGKHAHLFDKEGIAFFLYHHDSLKLWTSNALPVPENPEIFIDKNILKLHNFWVLKKEKSLNDYYLISLILIRTEYPYVNKVLKEGFQDDFTLSGDVGLILPGDENMNPVHNKNGGLIFSLDFTTAKKENKLKSFVCLGFYFICFFLFLTFLRKFLHNIPVEHKNYAFFLILIILFIFYFLIQYYQFPEIIFSLELFSPHTFARSSFLPSLGNLFLIIILGFFIIYNFYLEVYYNRDKLHKYKYYRYFLISILGISTLTLYFINTFLFRTLILDSSISFETYKALEISIYTFLGFLIIALVFSSWAILLDKVFGIFLRLNYRNEALIFLIALNITTVTIFFIIGSEIPPENIAFFILVSVVLYYFKIIRDLRYRISTYLIFVLIFTVYSVIQVLRYSELKADSDMRIMAVNLSSEHDPIAELLFVEISKNISSDKGLKDILFEPQIDFKAIYTELQRKYFSGYLDKYDLQITLCRPEDRVYVNPPDDQWEDCYRFFYEVIMHDAFEVPNSKFYFLNNLNGRISYFTPVTFNDKQKEITVFIELDSKLLSEGPGYPELLLDENLQQNIKDIYSYAKYYKGRLITSSGDFSYRMTSTSYTSGENAFEFKDSKEYNHLIYNIDNDNTIIVTRPSVQYIDVLISFSYIFVFYFFILIIILLLTNISPLLSDFQWNFKNKIQASMSSVIFFSILLIGTGTVYFSIRQYKNRQIEDLKEKVQSVYIEMLHNLEYEEDLHSWSSENYYNLGSLLQKFSNVFYTDINLYDEKGRLLATSRPEIFETGLIGRNINVVAYVEMIRNQRSEFIHNETIGELKYLSAYVPFVNSDNKLLAYLNLPYFTRQDEMTLEIANLLIAIINILVLLTVLSLTLAVFISNTITQPLRLIQEHISRFSLIKNNEKILYKGKDEIGSLVNEYNLMIDQLTESAEKLARSERETAWREMAKQIAHEIKNPLTPMRLILQHLQRSWKEDPEIREQQQQKLSKILIEQIDNLSKIAGEFSNFAKMPAARNERVNLISVVKNVAKLFEKTENISIKVKTETEEKLYVWADKEQISRVFINLLKNAIQSIPEGNEGIIEIFMTSSDKNAIVKVKDNGKGVAEEMEDKLFQPNFTTKTSGMGMGLAIAKNIITTSGGYIYYETEINKGSVFIVELPQMKE